VQTPRAASCRFGADVRGSGRLGNRRASALFGHVRQQAPQEEPSAVQPRQHGANRRAHEIRGFHLLAGGRPDDEPPWFVIGALLTAAVWCDRSRKP
jgi:hypothetical protein